LTFNNKK